MIPILAFLDHLIFDLRLRSPKGSDRQREVSDQNVAYQESSSSGATYRSDYVCHRTVEVCSVQDLAHWHQLSSSDPENSIQIDTASLTTIQTVNTLQCSPRLSVLSNKEQSDLTKGRIVLANPPKSRLYSPGGSIGLTVWPQFASACFDERFHLQISPSTGAPR